VPTQKQPLADGWIELQTILNKDEPDDLVVNQEKPANKPDQTL